MSPPPRYQRSPCYLSSRSSLPLPSQFTLTSPPRRRPHGSEVGKSIHKAAEAPQTYRLSPVSPRWVRERNQSVGSAKRILPSVPRTPQDSAIRFVSEPATARKSAGSGPVSKFLKRKANVHSGTESSISAQELMRGSLTRLPLEKLRREASLVDSVTTSDRDMPQVARKSVKRIVMKNVAIKAARKTNWTSGFSFNSLSNFGSSEESEDNSEKGDSDSESSPQSNDEKNVKEVSPSARPVARLASAIQDVAASQHETSHRSPARSRSISSFPSSPRAPIAQNRHSLAANKPLPLSTGRTSMLDEIDNDLPPPKPLLDAFQSLSLFPLHFHRTHHLPFLLRNVRTSFRALYHKLNKQSELDVPPSGRLVPLRYECRSKSGKLYTYDTVHPREECPICPIFGVFSSWGALKKHIQWDHSEILFELHPSDTGFRIVVCMTEDIRSSSVLSSSLEEPDDEDNKFKLGVANDIRKAVEIIESIHHKQEPKDSEIPADPSPTNLLHTEHLSVDTPQKRIAPKLPSPHLVTPGLEQPSQDIHVQAPSSSSNLQLKLGPVSHLEGLLLSPSSKSPTPPPASNPHGAAHFISANPGSDHLANMQRTTYRPTGPHLYDHLSSLPLEAFGHRSWFVLDKEEEIFELTDVLEEDKVICALWGRWILLNRPFFIANYRKGVEAFLDEYWLVIHHAAGWGAWRAWLMVLVSRRFLNNVEMVQMLKKYNNLVGKDKWAKS
ncbi:hypothetical protein K439DRAFT_742153 [Ramaria rubella]|nr:hypothetical protein K439DRAFT_742153 [Ramaria rubella]